MKKPPTPTPTPTKPKGEAPAPKGSPDQKPTGGELLVWNVPLDLRQRFKAACAGRRTTMRQAVLQLIRQFAEHWEHDVRQSEAQARAERAWQAKQTG